jgi:hypothetical protein
VQAERPIIEPVAAPLDPVPKATGIKDRAPTAMTLSYVNATIWLPHCGDRQAAHP